jgi:hypothetical protein
MESNPNLEDRLNSLEQKIDAVYISAEKTRKYFLWTAIVSVVVFVLPLIGIALVIPSFLSSYVGSIDTLSQ